MVNFGEFLKTWSLRSNSVTRQVIFNGTKIGGKWQNSIATFWVIFKQCAHGSNFVKSIMITMFEKYGWMIIIKFLCLENCPYGLFSRPHFNLERSLKTTYQKVTPSVPLVVLYCKVVVKLSLAVVVVCFWGRGFVLFYGPYIVLLVTCRMCFTKIRAPP